ncbi:histidine--tRNA ligase [Halobacteriales archaeon SW_5_70_135]|nr:MAG: histidine--tRNA ligase [Halobacteriales archaeon SW_5_70_135]
MAARRAVIDAVEGVCRSYGFREIDTPRVERAQMWTDKSGEEIVEELYAFEDRGGRHVTLTPELTPTVARMVAARQQELAKPIKWFSTRPFWRYEQVQQGRFRQFYQTNADVFGAASPAADAEILAVAADALTGLGLTAEEFEFRVSHREVLEGLINSYDEGGEIDSRAAMRAVDKSETVPEREYYDLLVEAGLTLDQAREFDALIERSDLDAVAETAGTDRVREATENLQAVLDTAEDFGVRRYCRLSLDTARGFDYYTGSVFECFDSAGEVSRAVFGGGRYDDLIESFGGQSTPAVGVAPGYAPLGLLLERADVAPEAAIETDYYVLRVGDTRSVAARIARELRERGHVVETDVADRSFGAQMSYADAVGAETVVIVGERDLADGTVTVKRMRDGEQTTAPVDAFPGDRERPTYGDFA